MARLLKRWESPRREGRNHKGKGGTARQRQLKKQTQLLRKKLQDGSQPEDGGRGQTGSTPSIFLGIKQVG
jgi:hypothetical protein